MRTLFAALVAAAALVVVAPSPASACSCVAQTPRELVAGADLVVAGTVVDRDDPLFSGEVTYTVDAETVYRGAVTERFTFRSAGDGGACGVEGVEPGGRVLLLLDEGEQGWHGSLCGGTGTVTEEQVRAFADPVEGQPLPGGPDGRTSSLPLVGLGAFAALAAVAGGWTLRRARRRARP
jgi:hypothetical protein